MQKYQNHQSLAFVFMALLAIPTAGCSSYSLAKAVLPIADRDVQQAAAEEIAELCEHEAGVKVYETANNVKGFVLMRWVTYGNGRDKPATSGSAGGCSLDCIQYLGIGYSYVEAELRKSSTHEKEYDFAAEPGLYRYHLIDHKDERCLKYEKVMRHAGAKFVIDQYSSVFTGKCVYAEPVATFKSRYAFEPMFNEQISISKKQTIRSLSARVIDRWTNKEMAIKNAYEVRNYKYVNHTTASCGFDTKLDIREVLKPPA